MDCYKLFALILEIKKRTNCQIEFRPLPYSPPYAIEFRATYGEATATRVLLEHELNPSVDIALENILYELVKSVIETDTRAKHVRRFDK